MARRFAGPKLLVATHNRGKAQEIRTMLAPFGVEIVSAGDLGLPAPAETGTTFEGNATLKALAATRASNLPALADYPTIAFNTTFQASGTGSQLNLPAITTIHGANGFVSVAVNAFAGGTAMGVGAKLARGCTSGLGLTGGATLSVGSWLFIMAAFAGAYAAAPLLRRAWR